MPIMGTALEIHRRILLWRKYTYINFLTITCSFVWAEYIQGVTLKHKSSINYSVYLRFKNIPDATNQNISDNC